MDSPQESTSNKIPNHGSKDESGMSLSIRPSTPASVSSLEEVGCEHPSCQEGSENRVACRRTIVPSIHFFELYASPKPTQTPDNQSQPIQQGAVSRKKRKQTRSLSKTSIVTERERQQAPSPTRPQRRPHVRMSSGDGLTTTHSETSSSEPLPYGAMDMLDKKIKGLFGRKRYPRNTRPPKKRAMGVAMARMRACFWCRGGPSVLS